MCVRAELTQFVEEEGGAASGVFWIFWQGKVGPAFKSEQSCPRCRLPEAMQVVAWWNDYSDLTCSAFFLYLFLSLYFSSSTVSVCNVSHRRYYYPLAHPFMSTRCDSWLVDSFDDWFDAVYNARFIFALRTALPSPFRSSLASFHLLYQCFILQ